MRTLSSKFNQIDIIILSKMNTFWCQMISFHSVNEMQGKIIGGTTLEFGIAAAEYAFPSLD